MMAKLPAATASEHTQQTYFIFDSDLNVVMMSPGERWPTAVLAGLRTCVRQALRDGDSSFEPFGYAPRWNVVPLKARDRQCIAVYPDDKA